MSASKVSIHELMAWDLDEYSFRDSAMEFDRAEFDERVRLAQLRLAERECFAGCDALLTEETRRIGHLLEEAARREDMRAEYDGLAWTLGVVDLRCLLAFQRRLVFNEALRFPAVPEREDWAKLVAFALGSARSTAYIARSRNTDDGLEVVLCSDNPDLQLRLNHEVSAGSPFSLYGGSPFLEVAELRGRWFLRDGYHRAYRLLHAGVHWVPAVVIRARTIEQVGATEPWFFSEEQLFSACPPRVVDFLDEELVLRYGRTALRKVIRVRIEESLEPVDECEEVKGDAL